MSIEPIILGVLNVTPDSFSDGGKYDKLDAAIAHAQKMISDGADLIDVGGESSRPFATNVRLDIELERSIPVVEALVSCGIKVSIDTRKYEVALAAVRAGASIINDISGGTDHRLIGLLKENPDVDLIMMHMKGTPQNMQVDPKYPDGVIVEVAAFLAQRVNAFTEAGVEKHRLWVDPGIGFGKNLSQNLELLRNLSVFSALGGRLVIGTSRKSMLSHLLGEKDGPIDSRLAGSIASNLHAFSVGGASVFRVHDVAEMKRALVTWRTIEGNNS
jgi:dihydropteroate synthase